ncbi:MAG: tRNA (adenosine(37)-N6)-threonylcarbamoyltransferase complex dimerization subunit type 1 TsaB [Gemmatales bacterium]|nr:tRNA (adenosine(37)-N6)-threonylcarbamoyltransferase complex dimerization subunit type 1 TsaB [Gemmatales bacterium]MCS7159694.1 tRNA (adenosine(37)-N6)-threonylcarbamoyltransferase complex dimerization subunit type 1 TsaB [Gemmatales bacterium]MDW8174892.1 tRNA (adenosine(37)-N6)-threonylcarbamoyltransferase complex dimerization subunit type 1 TsaB [Gemmatales bacterium]MDW8223179.1 tRNA (adenosine(37)-N6)-threonylcarbamoyltransferase complex dimerization subunit type 1 TsaB [Gemmatales bact
MAEGATLLRSARLSAARRHARDLAPTVKQLLEELGWRPTDLHAVAVSRGPGSYTGLRVGIMSAKALAYALNLPILAVDTFRILALQAGPGDDLDVLEDAQQDKVYVQRFRWAAPESPPEPITPLAIRPFTEWCAALPAARRVTGPALELDTIRSRLPSALAVLPRELWHPQLPALLTLALELWTRRDYADLWRLEPLYLRPSEAEEAWERRKPTSRP